MVYQLLSSLRIAQTRFSHAEESEEDIDDLVEECLSTNNTPSGPFACDYTVDGHLFNLANST
jgi:hypothetical protein